MSFEFSRTQKYTFNQKSIKEQVLTLIELTDFVENAISKQYDSNRESIKSIVSNFSDLKEMGNQQLNTNSNKLYSAHSQFTRNLKDLAKGAVAYHKKYRKTPIDFYDIKPLFDKLTEEEIRLIITQKPFYFELFAIYVQDEHFEIFLNTFLPQSSEINIEKLILTYFYAFSFSLTPQRVEFIYEILGDEKHVKMLNILKNLFKSNSSQLNIGNFLLKVDIFIAFLRNEDNVKEIIKCFPNFEYLDLLIDFLINSFKNKKDPNIKHGLFKLFNSDLVRLIFETPESSNKNIIVCYLIHIAGIYNVNYPSYLLKDITEITQLSNSQLIDLTLGFFHYGLNENVSEQLSQIVFQSLISHYRGGEFLLPFVINNIQSNFFEYNQKQILRKFFNMFNYNSACLFGLYIADQLHSRGSADHSAFIAEMDFEKDFYANYEKNKAKIKQIANNYLVIGVTDHFDLDYSAELLSLCISRIKKKWANESETEQEKRIVSTIENYRKENFSKFFSFVKEYIETFIDQDYRNALESFQRLDNDTDNRIFSIKCELENIIRKP